MILNNSNTFLKNQNLVIYSSQNYPRYESSIEYKIGQYNDGFPIILKKQESEISIHHTDSIYLLSNEFDNNINNHISKFIECIPVTIRNVVINYQLAQSTMIQLCSQLNSAKELLISNTNLLWLISINYFKGKFTYNDVEYLLSIKSKDTTKYIFPELIPQEKHVKFLSKVIVHNGDKEELEILSLALNKFDENTLSKINHWNKIPIRLLQQIICNPDLIVSKLFHKIADKHTHKENNDLKNTIKELAFLYTETLKAGELLQSNQSNALKNSLRKIETRGQLESLMGYKWKEKILKEQVKNKSIKLFPEPPVSGTQWIRPINNEYELYSEGKLMNNCVYRYLYQVLEGGMYFYSVKKPERGTLMISYSNNTYSIEEFSLKNNHVPSIDSYNIINEWINRYIKYDI